jgi:hypothetical protein
MLEVVVYCQIGPTQFDENKYAANKNDEVNDWCRLL